jgi:hypothetical protein
MVANCSRPDPPPAAMKPIQPSGTMEPLAPGVIKAPQEKLEGSMNGLIYLVGLVVVILAVLSFFGLR